MLDLIKDIFPPAHDLTILIEKDVVSNEMINTLITLLQEVRETITNEMQKAKLGTSIEFMEKLKATELEKHGNDEQRLQELENMFKSI